MAPHRTPDEEPAHDVLAADEFAMPGADPRLRQRRVVLPPDPSGIAEPHDILAAEEFAMPALPGETGHGTLTRAAEAPWWSMLGAAAGILALVGLRRRRH
jgi:hypothetical protein